MFLLRAEVNNVRPKGKSILPPIFCNKILLEQSMLISLYIVYSCFHSTMSELTSFDRNHTPCKAGNTTWPFKEKVYLPLLKKFKIWTNHIYNEAPLQAGSKSKLFSEQSEDIIFFTLIFSKYNMEFSRGYMMCDVTTDYTPKQTREYSCFPLS